MVASRKAADPHANRLLDLLPPRDYAASPASSTYSAEVQAVSLPRAQAHRICLFHRDTRPRALGRVSAHAGVSGHDAGGATDGRDGRGGRPATGRTHSLSMWQRDDHRSPRPVVTLVRVLRHFGDRSIRKARSSRLGNYTWLMGDERDGMKSIRPHSYRTESQTHRLVQRSRPFARQAVRADEFHD
jgi:hypothetical protein